jgi:hypothetical protein
MKELPLLYVLFFSFSLPTTTVVDVATMPIEKIFSKEKRFNVN